MNPAESVDISGAAITTHARCATTSPSLADREVADRNIMAVESALSASHLQREIPLYLHIIVSSAGDGDVGSSFVTAQIDVLNAAYARAGFHFLLAGTEKTVDDAWYKATPESPEESAMKKALHQGGPDALNVYTGINDGALLGWASWPWNYEASPELDGLVMHWRTMPGGGFSSPDPDEPDGVLDYSGGKTLVHEAGHWLGLYHTFESQLKANGCEGFGDAVDDTPAEKEPQYYCAARNSCAGGGADPIHNYMDYADDDCMRELSRGQARRAQAAARRYREPRNTAR